MDSELLRAGGACSRGPQAAIVRVIAVQFGRCDGLSILFSSSASVMRGA